MTVLLLAFYQLCTSAVSASDERSHAERLAFTAGTLALVLPLLALPLRSGGLLWRGDLNDRHAPGLCLNRSCSSACIRGLRSRTAKLTVCSS